MKIAIVTARYGPAVLGGAERLARHFAEAAAAAGWQVEAWSTCARDLQSWQNEFAAGQSQLNGVTLRRFPVADWQPQPWQQLNQRLLRQYSLPVDEQYGWLAAGPHSPALYTYVAQHAADFDAVIVVSYLSSISYYAAWAAPEHVLFMPTLHDELYAYLQPFRLLLEAVRGVLFIAPEEQQLALDRLQMRPQRQALLGAGVTAANAADGRSTLTPPATPYLLYMGRFDAAKNLALLYEYMQRLVDGGHDWQLLLTGAGDFTPPAHPAFDLRGFVTEADKRALIARATAVCQPSTNESFSLVIMEAWLAERPVLVHADCAVTSGHVQRSGGGITFRTFHQFTQALTQLQNQPALAQQLGANGRRYVRQQYSWPVIQKRFQQILAAWA